MMDKLAGEGTTPARSSSLLRNDTGTKCTPLSFYPLVRPNAGPAFRHFITHVVHVVSSHMPSYPDSCNPGKKSDGISWPLSHSPCCWEEIGKMEGEIARSHPEPKSYAMSHVTRG